MRAEPTITKIEVHHFQYELADLGGGPGGITYSPGSTSKRTAYAVRMLTDIGVTGEFVGGSAIDFAALPSFQHHLIGHNPLERELIYTRVKNQMRHAGAIGLAPVDITLWDFAGKYFDVPIHKLMGGYRKTLPTYPATLHGEEEPSGGLDSIEAFADFAQQCQELGYPAYKIHGWANGDADREVDNLLAVRERVGDKMDLMLDPFNALLTFADALKVGRACDEAEYFWYEDPLADGGISQFAHRKLRKFIQTPLLMTEHVRSLEPRMDFILADATDFVRGDVNYDGITGSMKLARAAESVGVDIEFHTPGPAQRQCMAAIRNSNYYELSGSHPKAKNANFVAPAYKGDYSDELDACDENGHFPVPQGPGLGVEYDWDFINKNRTALEVYE